MNLSAKTRTAAYKALIAVQPLAVAYGLLTQDMSALWVNAISAIGIAVLALLNITPDEKPADEKAPDGPDHRA